MLTPPLWPHLLAPLCLDIFILMFLSWWFWLSACDIKYFYHFLQIDESSWKMYFLKQTLLSLFNTFINFWYIVFKIGLFTFPTSLYFILYIVIFIRILIFLQLAFDPFTGCIQCQTLRIYWSCCRFAILDVAFTKANFNRY